MEGLRMNIFNRIFGSKDVIKKASEGIYNGVDAAFFTTEEKAQHFKELLTLYQPFKLAQRLLMMIICIPYISVWILSAALYGLSAAFDPCINEQVCKSYQLLSVAQDLAAFNNQTFGTPVAIILAFYFGGGALEGIVKAKK
jgi:ABC-type sulfate transport system permease component